MKIKPLFHKLNTILISSILVASFFLSSTQNAFAVIDRVRDSHIDDNGKCENDNEIKFNPMDIKDGNEDLEWEIDNPICITYVATAGVAVLGAVTASSYMCQTFQAAGIQAASLAAGVPLSPKMVKDRIKETAACARFTVSCAASGGVNAADCGFAGSCCAGTAITVATTGAAVAGLSIIWKAAVYSQKNAHLCGETWNTWEKRPARQLNESDGEGIPDYQTGSLPDDQYYIYGKRVHSYQKLLEDKFNPPSGSPLPADASINSKEYREYIYGGVEYEDKNSNGGACPLPKWSSETLKKILGYDSGNQRYYMRGPKISSNYACGRFLMYKGTKDERDSAKAAYDCCKKRSQETICIEEGDGLLNIVDAATGSMFGSLSSDTKYQFCRLGERCKVKDVWYEIHQAKQIPNYVCASTYSVCPYNHNLGGGTEIADYAPQHQDILLNHCQYLKHCAKVPDVPYIRTSNLDGGWISSACFDMKGDSQNNYGFTAQLLPVNTKNFSAPIAQCFKETLENIFINKAGHTKCSNPDESPDKNGNCNSGYLFKEGQVISGQKSFFQDVQDHLQTGIKMVMTIAVTIMGIGVLLTGNPWDKKTIMMFVIKLGLVAYFALGTAWQDTFFQGVSNTSMAFSNIFMRVDVSKSEDKKDGCQFPKYNSELMETNGVMVTTNPSYPEGKEYLAIWDMLDCKIARSLGFGLEASVPNLIYMILAGFLTGGMGIIFFIATFIFAFYLLAFTIRSLHIFLISSMAITIMIYVSPITITACLFKRTEGIFKQWRTNLISFVLQPVILFCYLGILISIFDGTVIGDATFSGDGIDAPKQIVCSSGNAANNSIYCIFKIKDVKTMNALAPLGIGLPVLFNMNPEKLATITKGAMLMFIFSKFLDQVLSLTKNIVGGNTLSSGAKGGLEALGKAYGITKAIQSRGKNATQKWGGKGASAAKRAVGRAGAAIGNGSSAPTPPSPPPSP